MSEIKKFQKIIEIVAELYTMDPEYFKDCFFNMYYQMKKKNTVDEFCEGDEEKIKDIWNTLNFYQSMCRKGQNKDQAFEVACNYYKVEQAHIKKIINKFLGFKGVKKTRFKDI